MELTHIFKNEIIPRIKMLWNQNPSYITTSGNVVKVNRILLAYTLSLESIYSREILSISNQTEVNQFLNYIVDMKSCLRIMTNKLYWCLNCDGSECTAQTFSDTCLKNLNDQKFEMIPDWIEWFQKIKTREIAEFYKYCHSTILILEEICDLLTLQTENFYKVPSAMPIRKTHKYALQVMYDDTPRKSPIQIKLMDDYLPTSYETLTYRQIVQLELTSEEKTNDKMWYERGHWMIYQTRNSFRDQSSNQSDNLNYISRILQTEYRQLREDFYTYRACVELFDSRCVFYSIRYVVLYAGLLVKLCEFLRKSRTSRELMQKYLSYFTSMISNLGKFNQKELSLFTHREDMEAIFNFLKYISATTNEMLYPQYLDYRTTAIILDQLKKMMITMRTEYKPGYLPYKYNREIFSLSWIPTWGGLDNLTAFGNFTSETRRSFEYHVSREDCMIMWLECGKCLRDLNYYNTKTCFSHSTCLLTCMACL